MILACLGISSSFTYTAPADCKLVLNCSGTNTSTPTVSVNGVSVSVLAQAVGILAERQEVYLGAGESAVIATGAQGNCCISAYWG